MKPHITVLIDEAVEALAIKSSGVIIDATLGSSGHARNIVSKLEKDGLFIGIDADQQAILEGQKTFSEALCHVELRVGNFRDINSILEQLHIEKADAILADLGWRMEQFSGNGRGFSFQVDEPLIMTFGDPSTYAFVAKDILNEWKETDIKNVLKGYGEEQFSGRIARHIVERREKTPFETTFDLVSVIEEAVPSFYKRGKINASTKTFQALRIAVNDEFDALENFLIKSIAHLKAGGRLAVITFHSTEDRIVKHLFRNYSHDHIGTVVNKKPIIASREEVARNPRARSAKLRVFEKI
ncbi:MAG: 16S rRNA (cytosine(1402)-N(4))-methyltransferase RsmH [Candidatus Pacebacteria bacterium]|nr:16S rRNA (cytosine(1402)-N(4))-methyltransferase RsmH [Candidatus Paceibacterota bacterium]MCF7857149.1 16S rRNA (cytosine(1402)-N(4))-methyltransferase RsmH [Candidatus Paceibacterota bacterium]